MKIQRKYTSLTCAAVALMLFAPLTAKADGLGDLIRLSHNLEEIVDDLTHEFSAHYRNSRSYGHLVLDLRKIRSEASHIHTLAHNRNASVHHIERDLDELDEYSHHLHNLVDQIERNAGNFAFRLFGDTRHVHTELASLNNNIHSMERAAARYERELAQRNHGGHHHGNHNAHNNNRGGNHNAHNNQHGRNRPVVRQPVIVRPPNPIEIHNRIRDAIFGRHRH